MNSKKILSLISLLTAAVLLAGCAAGPLVSSWPGVHVDENNVYIADAGQVSALRSADGGLIWNYPAEKGNRYFYAPPATGDGLVVVGDFAKTLVGLDAANGNEKWSFKESKDNWIAPSLLVGDVVLAPSADHILYALDRNGNKLWTLETGKALWSQPVSNGEEVYLGSMDHKVYAADLKTGAELWSVDLGGAVLGSPLLVDGRLYVGTLAGELLALDTLNSGAEYWRIKLDGALWATPVMHEGALYLGSQGGKVYRINAQSGAVEWEKDAGSPVVGIAAVVADKVVFGTEAGQVLTYNFDGTAGWTYTINGKLYSGIFASGERIIVPVMGGDQLIQTLMADGSASWSYTPAKK